MAVGCGHWQHQLPLAPETGDRLAANPLIAAQTRGLYGQATLDGVSTELFAFDASGTRRPRSSTADFPPHRTRWRSALERWVASAWRSATPW